MTLGDDIPARLDSRLQVAAGYAIGAVLVLAAAALARRWGVDAEGKSLEEIATPMGADRSR